MKQENMGEGLALPENVPPQKAAKPKRRKKTAGILRQILLGFAAFTLLILGLLWAFQILLLNPFYEYVKTQEIKKAADTLSTYLDGDPQARIEAALQIVSDLRANVYISTETGEIVLRNLVNEYRPPQIALLTQTERFQLFNQIHVNGRPYLTSYEMRDSYQNLVTVAIYAKAVQTPGGLNRLILLESEITPPSTIKDTLRVQLTWVTAVMVTLCIALAFFISRGISRPIVSINNSAKRLAFSRYDLHFAEKGSREVRELAQTLNYAARQLANADSLRKELLANVSHDLRTPLTMIKGYSEVMRDLPGENTPDNVQVIIDETARLTDLVNGLLDLSKLEAGAATLHISTFPLTQSIRETLKRYEKLADFTFTFDAREDLLVSADPLKISQVVYNLVSNAINYAGADKTVALAQTVQAGKVRISVTDHGEGIPQDKLQDIWERYYKVDREHKRAQVGTGLGLSIVRNILDLHGGTYGVSSQPGKGSTFWFELPLSPPQDNAQTENPKE